VRRPDDGVEEADPEDLAGLPQALGDLPVFARRRGVTRRVVVEDDHGHSSGEDAGLEDLARVHEGGGRADAHHEVGDRPVPAVQVEGNEVLAGIVGDELAAKATARPAWPITAATESRGPR